jgi:hypothetical protein
LVGNLSKEEREREREREREQTGDAILANISREESYCIRTSAKKGTILEDTNGGFSILPPSAAEFS